MSGHAYRLENIILFWKKQRRREENIKRCFNKACLNSKSLEEGAVKHKVETL